MKHLKILNKKNIKSSENFNERKPDENFRIDKLKTVQENKTLNKRNQKT